MLDVNGRPFVGILALLIASVATLAAYSALRSLRAAEEGFRAIYDRAGIAIWREDWTVVGEAIRLLRSNGVVDLESHFANRPEELRALRSQVQIKDVNAFSLEETGAPDKSAYLGSLDRLLPDTDQTFAQWLVAFGRGDRHFRSMAHITCPDGRELDVLFTAALPTDFVGFSDIIVISLDVTGFIRSQARLAAADTELARTVRISTVGALGASIAHEVNSPLAAILANAQAGLRWLRRPVPELEEATAALDDIVADATRARDVVARTRSFLSNAPRRLQPVDIVQAAREANLLIESELRRHGASVHLSPEENLPLLRADRIEIQQVFVNLLVNAAQAMSKQAGRRDITISFRRTEESLTVSVTDTGPGIPPDRRRRIFEAFHSDKLGGMGLGLAICRNLIDGHGGDIWAEAAPTGGAAFHFRLPILQG
ncbi:signal transduction histidine kinase [Methylobacterium sp. OAE515]|uniref:sensor histidine kinase n=1 Tax=Methylobacterium sp. OAE515 TaxID=2817895 RepID=UPI001789B724